VQVVFREEQAHHLRAEYCVKVVGTVQPRPAGNENPELATGEIEVNATALTVLSEAAPLPFPVDGGAAAGGEAGEDVRFKYRYLDLRRPGPGNALRLRSEASRIVRQVLDEAEFVEIETPSLTRSTPEGARDFLVPVRLQPGNWYALPQSPQLFK
jgi:aspartyl-tRNA synthetase